jgi:hypothetical protein
MLRTIIAIYVSPSTIFLNLSVLEDRKRGVETYPETVTRFKTTSRMKTGLKQQFEQCSVNDLISIADEIADVAADFQMFHLRELGVLADPVK